MSVAALFGLYTIRAQAATGAAAAEVAASDTEGQYALASLDAEPPAVPTGVAATAGTASPTVASVTWSVSSDNVAVAGYRVWRAVRSSGPYASVGTTSGLSFGDRSGAPGQDYLYAVSAFDAAGNESARSEATDPVRSQWTASPHTQATPSTNYCSWCHISHQAAASKLLRDTGATEVNTTTACYTCHGDGGDASNIESGSEDSFGLASGHMMEASGSPDDLTDTCADCHELHVDSKVSPKLPGALVNDAEVSAADNDWCLACHNADDDWYGPGYPSLSSPTRDVTGYPIKGTFPGPVVYANAAKNAHMSIPASSQEETRQAGSCLYCHAAHRGSNTYDGLRLTFRPTTASIVASDQASGSYAEACFYCHGGTTPSELTTAPANIKQYVTAGQPGSGHRVKTAGGTLPVGAPLPCYDCHNPHGSSRGNSFMFSDELGGDLSTDSDQEVRQFCLTCHSSSDGKVWDSVASTYAGVTTTDTVEGLPRDGTGGNALRLPSVTGHGSGSSASCYQCHGNSTTYNPHNPSPGGSEGAQSCYDCHSEYRAFMEDDSGAETGSDNQTVSHHVLGGAAGDGDIAPGTGSYETTTTDVYCTSCHTDHNYFGSNAENLRADIADPSGAVVASTDYSMTTDSGICTSCHAQSLAKQNMGTEQKDDGSSATPKIVAGSGVDTFGTSSHNYTVTSQFGDGSSFEANCSKCHNDEDSPAYKENQTSVNRFGTHWSAERRILSALGGSLTDPLGEQHCFGCHSGGVAGNDYYGGYAMTQESRSTEIEFGLASTHPVVATGGNSVECVNCHNPHTVGSGGGTLSDPTNTYNSVAYGTEADKAAFCLNCHSGAASLPSRTVDDTTYVPSSVTMAAADEGVMDKSVYGARGHWSAAGSISSGEVVSCSVCHAKHGSSYPRLLGAYDPTTGTNRVNGVAIAGNDNTVCEVCHSMATTGYPGTSRDANDYPGDGTYPGALVYNGSNGIHRAGGALADNVVWPGSTYADGDCKNCHDPHGTANDYDQLRSPDENPSFTNDSFTLCFNCHDGGASTQDIKVHYPTEVGGTATQTATSRFGHKTETPGTLPAGSALPCYDCHNPHGSPNAPAGLFVVTMTDATTTVALGDDAGEIDISSPGGYRRFCFSCHTTAGASVSDSDPYGWDGSGYAIVGAGALVEGIDRTVYDAANERGLQLPPRSGHYLGDMQTCSGCHGNTYTGGSPNNVHNPGPG